MLQYAIKDGNKKVRSLEINSFMKPSGIVCASVRNDKGDTYFVQVNPDGSHTCKHIVNGKRVSCLGHFHTGHCYHLEAVQNMEHQEVAGEVVEVAEVAPIAHLEDYRLFAAPDAYEVLGATKDVVNNKINPVTGMTDADWQNYQYYLMGIGA